MFKTSLFIILFILIRLLIIIKNEDINNCINSVEHHFSNCVGRTNSYCTVGIKTIDGSDWCKSFNWMCCLNWKNIECNSLVLKEKCGENLTNQYIENLEKDLPNCGQYNKGSIHCDSLLKSGSCLLKAQEKAKKCLIKIAIEQKCKLNDEENDLDCGENSNALCCSTWISYNCFIDAIIEFCGICMYNEILKELYDKKLKIVEENLCSNYFTGSNFCHNLTKFNKYHITTKIVECSSNEQINYSSYIFIEKFTILKILFFFIAALILKNKILLS